MFRGLERFLSFIFFLWGGLERLNKEEIKVCEVHSIWIV
jgi:hypothetical protein